MTAGYYGDFSCDTSPGLLEAMLQAAASLNPDYVFLTGDDPPHNVWRYDENKNEGCYGLKILFRVLCFNLG